MAGCWAAYNNKAAAPATAKPAPTTAWLTGTIAPPEPAEVEEELLAAETVAATVA